MDARLSGVYEVVNNIMRSFERMAIVAEHTAETTDNVKYSEQWSLIADIWMEAHMLAAHRLSVYMAEQVQMPDAAKPED